MIFLIGDFTGLIGDPTGKKSTRPQLTQEEIEANAATYKRQIYKLLDPDTTVIDFNSRWLGALSSADWIRLAANSAAGWLSDRFGRRRDLLLAAALLWLSALGSGLHRPALQPAGGSPPDARAWAGAAGGHDFAVA